MTRDDLTQLLVDEDQRREIPPAFPQQPPIGSLADPIPKNNPLPLVEHPDVISQMTARDPRIPLTDLQAQQRKIAFGTTGLPGEQRGIGALDFTPIGTIAQVGEAIEKHDPFSFAGAFNPMGGAAAGLAGAAAKFAPAMFLGAGAVGAPKKAFTLARKMEREGATPGAIMDATADLPAGRTGLEKLADKKYRYEISDEASSINQDVLSKAPMATLGVGGGVGFILPSVFNHPELYKAYPWMKDITVKRIPDNTQGIRGGFDPDTKELFINAGLSPEETRKVFLHELQHSVQDFEKFAQGGSQYMQPVITRGRKIEKEVAEMNFEKRSALLRQVETYINEKTAGTASVKQREVLAEVWAKEHPDLAKEFLETNQQLKNIPLAARYEAYRRMLGEAEARNTAERADLPIASRFLKRPETTEDIPREKQWPYREAPTEPTYPQQSLRLKQDAPGSILSPGYLSPKDQATFTARYPKAGDWEWRTDKTKGTQYQAKVQTPEEQRLMAARTKIMEDMKNEPWTPLFDPEKRYPVDYNAYVKQFGTPEDTRALRMSRPATAQTHLGIATGEEAQTKLAAALAEGEKIEPAAGRFYEVGQAEKPFLDYYKKDPTTARAEFRKNFPQPMAATTGGSDPTSNLLQTGYVNWLREHGKKTPGESWDVPSPLGSSKFSVRKNLETAETMLGPQGTGITTANPKRYDFDWNFLGRKDAPVMDDQMLQIINPALKGSPPKGGYGLYAEAVHQMPAVTSGARTPQSVQELAWAGGKRLKEIEAAMQPTKSGKPGKTFEEAEKLAFAGKPMIADINEAVERTSRLLQIPPEEAYRRMFIEKGKKRIPIYGLVGAGVGLGALADQSRYEQ